MVKEDKKSKVFTLNEAIERSERMANDNDAIIACRDGHRQLAEWLKELKELRKERIELKKQNLILRFIVALYEEDDEPDWIPVEEELPEECGRYLVSIKKSCGIPRRVDIFDYGTMPMGEDEEPHWHYNLTEFAMCMDDEVEAWMKLPDPCEE